MVRKTYNFDAEHEMHPCRVRLHAWRVQEGALKRKNTHNWCVLVDGKYRTAMDGKTHLKVGVSIRRLRNSVVIH